MKELSTLATHLQVVLEMPGSEPEGTPEVTGQRLGDLPETWRVLSPPLPLIQPHYSFVDQPQLHQLHLGPYKKCRCSVPAPAF